jgi:apoptosis-inducing factor 3
MVEFDGVPFFWTRQYDAGLLYAGHAASWDEIIFEGDVPSQNFLAFYVKDERVLAVAGMNRDREMAVLEELLRLHRMPTPDRLRHGHVDFSQLLDDEIVIPTLDRRIPTLTV